MKQGYQSLEHSVRYKNMFELQAENSSARHSKKEIVELRTRKRYHKEYGKSLNNKKAKENLLSAIVDSMSNKLNANFVLKVQ